MKAKDAELDILFSDFPLEVAPEIKAQIYFPIVQKPDIEELRFLRKMFIPMGWTPANVQYHYLETRNMELSPNSGVIHMLFGFSGKSENQPEVQKNGEIIQLFLPQLHLIQTNLDLKNKVWLAMKPFAST